MDLRYSTPTGFSSQAPPSTIGSPWGERAVGGPSTPAQPALPMLMGGSADQTPLAKLAGRTVPAHRTGEARTLSLCKAQKAPAQAQATAKLHVHDDPRSKPAITEAGGVPEDLRDALVAAVAAAAEGTHRVS